MNVAQLIGQGLVMTVLGMGLVFAALVLLWALIRLLGVILADREEPTGAPLVIPIQASIAVTTPEGISTQTAVDAQTSERARVAAIVASALLANALPLHFEVPTGPVFEHGRTAPLWVTSNRSRALQSWQPPRTAEGSSRGQD